MNRLGGPDAFGLACPLTLYDLPPEERVGALRTKCWRTHADSSPAED